MGLIRPARQLGPLINIFTVQIVTLPDPGKTTVIRRIAVRETSYTSNLRATLKSLGPLQHYFIEGLKEALNMAPTMPRDTSFSDRYIYIRLITVVFPVRSGMQCVTVTQLFGL